MKQISFAIPLLFLALNACAPAAQPPIEQPPTEQPAMDEPVNSETPPAQQTSSISPSPSDLNLMRGEVYLDSTELLTMESYPPQFMLVLKGSLPTPCHQIRIAVSPPDTENKIVVEVYSVADPNAICVQMLEPFEVNFPLGSFPAGKYTLWVNGEMAAEFQS